VPEIAQPPPQPGGAAALLRQLTHERDLLAQALGRVLVATGVANDMPLTGPQLLLLADDYVEHVTGVRPSA
jgi:hypothetical protein